MVPDIYMLYVGYKRLAVFTRVKFLLDQLSVVPLQSSSVVVCVYLDEGNQLGSAS